MAEKFVSERNLKFMLYEVFDVASLTDHPYYAEHTSETFDMILETALKIGRDMLKPALEEMDRNQPELVGDEVRVHPVVREFLKECGEGGWIPATAPEEHGGLQLPIIIGMIPRFVFMAANYSGSVYMLLCYGAAHLITSFGSEELIDTYVPRMFAGEWQGTMALTEPQAGSSLSDIATTAEPTDHGYYKIRGQKIFISASDHNAVDNVVHLMLAKIKGAPPGVKGISLFVVPKLRIEESGDLVPNDVNIAGIYHKLGYRGAPILQLSMGENDDCRGRLVGEPHKGLVYMFQMMNEARIEVGLGATAIASAAYYASLEYVRERPQGRKPGTKDPALPQVPIIEHADIKRMLLFQRAVVEGSLSILLQCSKYADLEIVSSGEDKKKYGMLLDLLTPVAKSYPSEMGVQSVSQGLQCLGGYGYCDEFPLEQYFRDSRIHPIHEGTTAIHGITLLGRNIPMKNGAGYRLFLDEVREAVAAAEKEPALAPQAASMAEAVEKLERVTDYLLGISEKVGTERFLADATLYLELFGIVCIAWQWLLQASAAQSALKDDSSEADVNFYEGKKATCRYFFAYELPKIEGLAKRLMNNDGLTVEMKEAYFDD
ncbi:MAG: acyl-CoA dehydrogenase [Deltaproteobacteria bacterium]|nr:acyl-CoA dehydrogenase [Deltaproteobacteria bacterium]